MQRRLNKKKQREENAKAVQEKDNKSASAGYATSSNIKSTTFFKQLQEAAANQVGFCGFWLEIVDGNGADFPASFFFLI